MLGNVMCAKIYNHFSFHILLEFLSHSAKKKKEKRRRRHYFHQFSGIYGRAYTLIETKLLFKRKHSDTAGGLDPFFFDLSNTETKTRCLTTWPLGLKTLFSCPFLIFSKLRSDFGWQKGNPLEL